MKKRGTSFDRQGYYDVMRNLLVILVVIGHATYYDIVTLVGGIQYGRSWNA